MTTPVKGAAPTRGAGRQSVATATMTRGGRCARQGELATGIRHTCGRGETYAHAVGNRTRADGAGNGRADVETQAAIVAGTSSRVRTRLRAADRGGIEHSGERADGNHEPARAGRAGWQPAGADGRRRIRDPRRGVSCKRRPHARRGARRAAQGPGGHHGHAHRDGRGGRPQPGVHTGRAAPDHGAVADMADRHALARRKALHDGAPGAARARRDGAGLHHALAAPTPRTDRGDGRGRDRGRRTDQGRGRADDAPPDGGAGRAAAAIEGGGRDIRPAGRPGRQTTRRAAGGSDRTADDPRRRTRGAGRLGRRQDPRPAGHAGRADGHRADPGDRPQRSDAVLGRERRGHGRWAAAGPQRADSGARRAGPGQQGAARLVQQRETLGGGRRSDAQQRRPDGGDRARDTHRRGEPDRGRVADRSRPARTSRRNHRRLGGRGQRGRDASRGGRPTPGPTREREGRLEPVERRHQAARRARRQQRRADERARARHPAQRAGERAERGAHAGETSDRRTALPGADGDQCGRDRDPDARRHTAQRQLGAGADRGNHGNHKLDRPAVADGADPPDRRGGAAAAARHHGPRAT